MDDARFLHDLRRYWDEIARGGPATPGDLDPELAALIRRLHATRDVPPPNPTFARQLRESIMHSSSAPIPLTVGPPRDGHTTPPLPRLLPPMAPLPRSSRRWEAAQTAIALLLIGTLLTVYFATFGRDERPLIMPAAGSPIPSETDETPVAEFTWQTKGGPDLPLDPINPAIDPDGNLWVPDGRHHRFQIFAPDGAFLEAWGESGSAEGQFDFQDPAISAGNGQASAAFDSAGNLYVVDTGNRRVQKFGPDRRFITAWGSEGDGDGHFLVPIDLAVDGQGRVYVSDGGRDDVQVFTAEGGFLAAWDADAYGGIAVAPDGSIWITDGYASRVQQYSSDGELLAMWDETGSGEGQFLNPSDVAVDGQGRVYLADFGNNRVQVFTAAGQFLAEWGQAGSGEGDFSSPNSLVLDGLGNVYVAEESGNRVQKFRLLPPLVP